MWQREVPHKYDLLWGAWEFPTGPQQCSLEKLVLYQAACVVGFLLSQVQLGGNSNLAVVKCVSSELHVYRILHSTLNDYQARRNFSSYASPFVIHSCFPGSTVQEGLKDLQ